MSSSSTRRKVIAAREDLVNAITMIAKKRGSTLYALVNELLEQAVRAEELGITIKEALDLYELIKAHRNAGQTLIPIEVLNTLAEQVYSNPELANRLEEMWFEAGVWYGEYLAIRFRIDSDSVDNNRLAKLVNDILRETRWDFAEVSVRPEDTGIRVRCVSLLLNVYATKMVAKFIEGLMKSFRYETKREEIRKGLIDLLFEKKQA